MLHSASVHIGRANTEQPFRRHIVVGVDLQDTSLRALQWAINEFVRPIGDCVHVVHVDRYQSPQMGIQHSYPGMSYTIPDLNPMDGDQHADAVKAILHARFTSLLEQRDLPHVLHLFTDTDNAPASAVTDVLFKVSAEVKAALLVVAAHNKAYGWNNLLLGSVADHCVQHCTVPLMVVRDYLTNAPSNPPSTSGTPKQAQQPQDIRRQEAVPDQAQPAKEQQAFILRPQGSVPVSPTASAGGTAVKSPASAAGGDGLTGLMRASSLKHPGELATRVSRGGGGGGEGSAMPSTLVFPWSSPATSPLASPNASTILKQVMSGGGGGAAGGKHE